MRKLIIILLCAVSSALCGGEKVINSVTTKSGKEYTDYELVGVTESGIKIMHRKGIAIIPFDDWPDDRFVKERKQILEKRLVAREKLQRTEKLYLIVISVESDALLCAIYTNAMRAADIYNKDEISLESKWKKIYELANDMQAAAFNNTYKANISCGEDRETAIRNALNYMIFKMQTADEMEAVYVDGLEDTSKYYDNQKIALRAERSGTHQYITVQGAQKTIKKYTAVKLD